MAQANQQPDAPDYDVQENEDGSADVMEPDTSPEEVAEFYDNLVFDIPQGVLDDMAIELLDLIEVDKKQREPRDQLYAEGIRRTGLGKDAPGGGQFQGASKVVHPLLTNGAVEFEARTIKEIFPPGGPAKTFIPGTVTKARFEKAERQKAYFNWLLTKRVEEFKSELEKTLIQEALGGVCYQRITQCERFKRPIVRSVTSDRVLIPYDCASFYTAERITYVEDITDFEYKQRVKSGMYLEVDMVSPSMAPEASASEEARAKVEGKDRNSASNEDGTRRVFEVSTFLEGIEEHAGGNAPQRTLPYLIGIDETTKKVVRVVRNWEEDDERAERMHWIIEWGFVPWEGALPIGLVHMVGGLSGAATGALRALLDAAHVNNFPTAARLKGATVSGQSKSMVQPTEIVEIDGGVGAEDIRKLMMPFPFNPPSPTLFQLLEFVVQSGQEVVRTAFEKFVTENPNAPVGTTYAIIEQGLVVVAAIIGRQHASMQKCFDVFYRLSRMYLNDDEIKDEVGEVLAYRKDFEGPMDVVPISDPSVPSDAHRMAQTQTLLQRSATLPQIYDIRKVEKFFLERLRLPDPDQFLIPAQEPQDMNPANENAASAAGRPIAVFPEQDDLAHIQTHMDYMMSPLFGMNPVVAPKMLPIMVDHIAQHMSMWYTKRVYQRASAAAKRDVSEFMKINDPEVKAEIEKLIAAVSPDVMGEASKLFSKLMPKLQQAQQMAQQLQPQMQDPNAMVQQQRNQIQAKKNEDDAALRRQELQQKAEDRNMRVVEGGKKIQSDVMRDQMQQEGENQRTALAEQGDTQRTMANNQTKERINQEDNATALTIASAEIESGEKIAESTGKDTNPGQ
jgi:hypothetical protein